MTYANNEERLEAVAAKCSTRYEIRAYVLMLKGATVSPDEFIKGYKALGLSRTSPAKGRGLYRFLIKENYIHI